MGDFNIEPNNCMFKSLSDSNNLTNLIKANTFFKGKGSSIDLILTNRGYSFKYTSSYETGRDHHHKIYTMLNSSFINIDPKLLNYRDYNNFNLVSFKEDLSEALLIYRNSYDEFESAFRTALDKHAPTKKKWLRENNEPNITKPLRQALIKCSKLKNKTNKTKLHTDIRNYKEQQNYVGNLNKNAKFQYFSQYGSINGKPFG